MREFQKTKKFFRWQEKAEKICKKRKGNKKGCSKIPLAYAGRLDPMAHGKMLILAGEACKEREKYLNLDKEYIFEVLLGFSSDTGDILGMIKNDLKYLEHNNFSKINNLWNIRKWKEKFKLKKKVRKILKNMKGKRIMKYPIFSSKAVQGKPLFLWALEKKTDEIKIPTKEVEIFKIKLLKINFINKNKLEKEIFLKINNLKKVRDQSKELGQDFRKIEVLKSWEKYLESFSSKNKFIILKIKTKVSSGTYMRNLAEEIAGELGTGGLAYSIKRTKFFN